MKAMKGKLLVLIIQSNQFVIGSCNDCLGVLTLTVDFQMYGY